MSTDPQVIHAQSHAEIGRVIERDADLLLARWAQRAIEEQPQAERMHQEALFNHFRVFLKALSKSLVETHETAVVGHRLIATVHGEQRWNVGWTLPELIRDYQILRLVIAEHLEGTLERPLRPAEVMAIGLNLDEAIAASAVMYVHSRDEERQQFEESRAALDRNIQEQLRQKAEALQQSDRRKNEFLATLSHELRNPLAPLRTGVAVLRSHPTQDPVVVEIRDMFDRQVQQMSMLLDDLLDVSRIAQGKVVLRRERVELATVVRQAAQVSEPLLKARHIRFSVTIPPDAIWVDADATRLTQIIVNLLNNAAKYTQHGGQVAIVIEREDDTAVIRVSDTGDGIDPQLLPHIFDLFTQAEWPVDRSQGGLGIGLALVRRLTELHDGSITATSPGPGKGSEFVVRIPALVEPPPPREPISSFADKRPAPAIVPRRILVVDDSADAATSLAMLLKLYGHNTHVAHDGISALQRATEFQPDVVLLDIGLPRIDGYQVARQLREQPGGDRLLIVALTGYGRESDRERSAANGFAAHLVKPVSMDALMDVLSRPRHA